MPKFTNATTMHARDPAAIGRLAVTKRTNFLVIGQAVVVVLN